MINGHAELSPSSASTWIRCPGSIKAQRGIPNNSSEYAEEGTAAHFLASWCLQNNMDTEACLGREIALWRHDESDSKGEAWIEDVSPEADIYNSFIVDSEMVEAIQTYINHVRTYAMHGQLFVEVRVPLTHITTEPDAYGTSDALILTNDFKEIIVTDLKYGQGLPVYATENEQLSMYALGAVAWLELLGLAEQVERVRLVIIQPRIDDRPSEWDCTLEELKAFGARANLSAVHGLTSDTPVFNAGPKQCKWCRAKAECLHAEKYAIGAIINDFDVVGSDQDKVEEKLDQAIEVIPQHAAEHLGWLMDRLAFIEDWTRAIRARGEELIFNGVSIPGYKVVKGKMGSRAWSDAKVAEETMQSMRLKVDEMYTKKLISPTQAEKVLKKTSPRKWERLTPLITQAEGNNAIVPVSDPRPEVVITPTADQFDAVDEPPLA